MLLRLPAPPGAVTVHQVSLAYFGTTIALALAQCFWRSSGKRPLPFQPLSRWPMALSPRRGRALLPCQCFATVILCTLRAGKPCRGSTLPYALLPVLLHFSPFLWLPFPCCGYAWRALHCRYTRGSGRSRKIVRAAVHFGCARTVGTACSHIEISAFRYNNSLSQM